MKGLAEIVADNRAVTSFEERRRVRIDRSYEELKALDPDTYRRCVATADALAINHGLTLPQSAAVESAMIELVLDVRSRHG